MDVERQKVLKIPVHRGFVCLFMKFGFHGYFCIEIPFPESEFSKSYSLWVIGAALFSAADIASWDWEVSINGLQIQNQHHLLPLPRHNLHRNFGVFIEIFRCTTHYGQTQLNWPLKPWNQHPQNSWPIPEEKTDLDFCPCSRDLQIKGHLGGFCHLFVQTHDIFCMFLLKANLLGKTKQSDFSKCVYVFKAKASINNKQPQ